MPTLDGRAGGVEGVLDAILLSLTSTSVAADADHRDAAGGGQRSCSFSRS
jgi:hypothetical protein